MEHRLAMLWALRRWQRGDRTTIVRVLRMWQRSGGVEKRMEISDDQVGASLRKVHVRQGEREGG